MACQIQHFPLNVFVSPTAYAAAADLVHYLRGDLSPRQLAHFIHVYSRVIHNPCLSSSVHTLAGKMMFNLIETVITKDTPAGAAKVLAALMETCVDRLESLTAVLDEVQQRSECRKNGEAESGNFFIVEKARPVASAVYAADEPDNVLSGKCTPTTLQHSLRRRQNSGFCSEPLHTACGLVLVLSRRLMHQFPMGHSC